MLLLYSQNILSAPQSNFQPMMVPYNPDLESAGSSIWDFNSYGEEDEIEDSNIESALDSAESDTLYKYAERDGPHADASGPYATYNISPEDEDDLSDAIVFNEDESAPCEATVKPPCSSTKAPCTKLTTPCTTKSPKCTKPACTKCAKKKRVYVYKQQPIVINPKPTNIQIKSRPIVVRPPPIVVHHPAEQPCNPVIKYQPPKINIRPVIVKIKKTKPTTKAPCTTTPKPCTSTTTTTTPKPCTKTTKKPCGCATKKPKCSCSRCVKRAKKPYRTLNRASNRASSNKVQYYTYNEEDGSMVQSEQSQYLVD